MTLFESFLCISSQMLRFFLHLFSFMVQLSHSYVATGHTRAFTSINLVVSFKLWLFHINFVSTLSQYSSLLPAFLWYPCCTLHLLLSVNQWSQILERAHLFQFILPFTTMLYILVFKKVIVLHNVTMIAEDSSPDKVLSLCRMNGLFLEIVLRFWRPSRR